MRVIIEAATANATLGEPGIALGFLETALRNGYGVREIEHRHEFRALHGDERYQRLIAEAKAARQPQT